MSRISKTITVGPVYTEPQRDPKLTFTFERQVLHDTSDDLIQKDLEEMYKREEEQKLLESQLKLEPGSRNEHLMRRYGITSTENTVDAYPDLGGEKKHLTLYMPTDGQITADKRPVPYTVTITDVPDTHGNLFSYIFPLSYTATAGDKPLYKIDNTNVIVDDQYNILESEDLMLPTLLLKIKKTGFGSLGEEEISALIEHGMTGLDLKIVGKGVKVFTKVLTDTEVDPDPVLESVADVDPERTRLESVAYGNPQRVQEFIDEVLTEGSIIKLTDDIHRPMQDVKIVAIHKTNGPPGPRRRTINIIVGFQNDLFHVVHQEGESKMGKATETLVKNSNISWLNHEEGHRTPEPVLKYSKLKPGTKFRN